MRPSRPLLTTRRPRPSCVSVSDLVAAVNGSRSPSSRTCSIRQSTTRRRLRPATTGRHANTGRHATPGGAQRRETPHHTTSRRPRHQEATIKDAPTPAGARRRLPPRQQPRPAEVASHPQTGRAPQRAAAATGVFLLFYVETVVVLPLGNPRFV